MSQLIKPLTLSAETFVERVKKSFGLNVPPFSSIDSELLLLAFTASCSFLSPPFKRDLISHFGVCNFQSLEFYGDRVLYDVTSLILYDTFGLEATPSFLTQVTSFLTNNRSLTDIMINKNACSLVRSPPYMIKEGRKFHNLCADSFEALVGALFIHLINLNLDHSLYITSWILRNTSLPAFLYEYLADKGINALVYSPVTKEELESREGKGEKNSSLLTYTNKPLSQIYAELGWKYSPPIKEKKGVYLLYGEPNGEEKVIAEGKTSKEAEKRGLQYLIDMGYIIPLQE